MGWNPWTPHGVRGVHQESRWNPGGNRQKFGWAPCQINSTWTPGGLHESTWIPGGMTRNLWGSVKSSHDIKVDLCPGYHPDLLQIYWTTQHSLVENWEENIDY